MTIERRPIIDREQWLAWRRQDVTASTIGALFNAHPYSTALRLYAEKRGVEFEQKDNNVMRRGRWLEPAVAKAVSELKSEWKLEAPDIYLRDPQLRLGATPDFFIHNDPRGLGVLQCKTSAPSVYERDWLGGTEIPFWIVLQTLTECLLSEAAFGAVAVMLVDPHNIDCKILDVPRHSAAEHRIIERVTDFWIAVEQAREPEPDFERDSAVIRALTAKEIAGKTLDLGSHNELPVMLETRAQLMARIKRDEARCEQIENEVRHLMGAAESITGLPDWRITYKTSDFKGYTVQPRSQRVLRIFDKRPQEERPQT
jgi:predicted phage-related endonuclease